MNRITLNFRKSTEESPEPNQKIFVIDVQTLGFGSTVDSWEIWKPVAINENGEEYDYSIPFNELKNEDDVEVEYKSGSGCSLQTFLEKVYLWIPIKEYNAVLTFLGLTNY